MKSIYTVTLALLALASNAVHAFTFTVKATTQSPHSKMTPLQMSATPNSVIKVAAQGMGLLKPLFVAEAKIQAAVLGLGVDRAQVQAELDEAKENNRVLIYTYSLSPFSSEAVNLLTASGYPFTQVVLGAEWFLLGGRGSLKRVLMADQVQGGATSLPKIFIGGKCIGGCAELANLVETGELDSLMKQAGVRKL